MKAPDLIVSSSRVVTPDGVRSGSVVVSGGVVVAVEPPGTPVPDAPHLDAGDAMVMPGLVDSHVHVNDPGRADWEGFEAATKAAAAGGITTLVDMPLNSSPVTTTPAALEAKTAAAEGRCWVDYGVWGGVVPTNRDQLAPLRDAGVLGYKCFLVDSGLEEFPPVSVKELARVLPVLNELDAVLLVHAELPEPIARAAPGCGLEAQPTSYDAFLRSRPVEAETQAVAALVRLSAETGAAVHVVHVSAAETADVLAEVRGRGLPVTAETCPHYLTFAAEEVPDGATAFKCAPPIREARHREALWQALDDGVLDLVAGDHSPCPVALKRLDSGNFAEAWGGISSLQLSLPAVWTEARSRGHTVSDVMSWMCEAPARLAGVADRKGRIAPGYDADLVIWDPEASFRVDVGELKHRHPITPYSGRTLFGRVLTTVLRGNVIYDQNQTFGEPMGHWIRGSRA